MIYIYSLNNKIIMQKIKKNQKIKKIVNQNQAN